MASPRQRFRASQDRAKLRARQALAEAQILKAGDYKPPTRPPTGYYDPSIDAQVRAGARGLGDLRIDHDTAIRRGNEDFSTGMAGFRRGREQTLADLMTGETRLRDDHRLATEDLGRQFGLLGQQQAQGARARGVLSSGLAARAAGIRGANQGRAQAGLDLSRDRGLADIGTRRQRFEEDYLARTGEFQTGFDRQFGQGGDLDLQLARAEREQPFLEADANELRLSQANAAGYVPPARPRRSRFGRVGRTRFGVG